MSKSKLLSLFVSAFYVIAFIFVIGRDLSFSLGFLLVYLSIPLGCIWFSDEIAVVFDRGRWPELNPDWGFFVRFMGWVMLLLPAIILIYRKMK